MLANPTEVINELSLEDLQQIKTKEDLLRITTEKQIVIKRHVTFIEYERELRELQTCLVKLQNWIVKKKMRVAILFEGRDAAGKGGTIKRFKEHLNPRSSRVVALTKPTDIEKSQWFFRRYIKELPNPGEMVFFDRSWYNRAVVEPVMGFCTNEEYERFLVQVPEFEHMLYEDGVILIKFWFSVSKNEQKKRFESRLRNPLKRWKFSPVDMKGQELWEDYTHFKERMFLNTHTQFSPWMIINSNSKRVARLESIRYILSKFDYDGKEEDLEKFTLMPDPNIVARYYRLMKQLDN